MTVMRIYWLKLDIKWHGVVNMEVSLL